MSEKTYPITGLWLRTIGGGDTPQRVQVLVEHDGAWRVAIDEHTAGEIGHIVEVLGLERLEPAAGPPLTCTVEMAPEVVRFPLPTGESANFETARSAYERPIVRHLVLDHDGAIVAIRDTPEEAAAYVVARLRRLEAEPVAAVERRMTIEQVHERPINA